MLFCTGLPPRAKFRTSSATITATFNCASFVDAAIWGGDDYIFHLDQGKVLRRFLGKDIQSRARHMPAC